jgi:hypothetical protein
MLIATNVSLFKRKREKLRREVRGLIYELIWDEEEVEHTDRVMKNTIEQKCHIYNELEKLDCASHVSNPHHVSSCFVGK